MSPFNPANHTSRPWQQTLLLASDCKNSVLAEMDGAINRMAYTPYGQQSALRNAWTHLGFNGELREARTDWYFLGNGNRTYNPRLMRFHSPDKLSPFGKGGLNAYMYCGGEPVMRADPTGRSFLNAVIGKVFKVWDFFSLNNNSSGPLRNTLPVTARSGKNGFLEVASGVVAMTEKNRRPPIISTGGKSRRHAAPSWKGIQGSDRSNTLRVHWAAQTDSLGTSKHTTTTPAAPSESSSRRPSISSNSSSASTPSTVSTISSISQYSNDSGYASSNPGSIRSNGSADNQLQARLDDLRKN